MEEGHEYQITGSEVPNHNTFCEEKNMKRELLRELSIRCSGLMTEAGLNKDMNQQEIAEFLDVSDRTLREKSRTKQMYTIPIGKIAALAGLAGYEIEFRRVE